MTVGDQGRREGKAEAGGGGTSSVPLGLPIQLSHTCSQRVSSFECLPVRLDHLDPLQESSNVLGAVLWENGRLFGRVKSELVKKQDD